MNLSKAVGCKELGFIDDLVKSEYFITGSAVWGTFARDLDICVNITKSEFLKCMEETAYKHAFKEGKYYENNVTFPGLKGSYNGKKNLPIQLIFLGKENYEIWKMATDIMVNTLKVNKEDKAVTHALFEGLRALIKLSGSVEGMLEKKLRWDIL
jgi:hypothetical protein